MVHGLFLFRGVYTLLYERMVLIMDDRFAELRRMTVLERTNKYLGLLRGCLGWNQGQLALRLGISRQSLSAIETGRVKAREMLYLAVAKILMDEFDMNPDECAAARTVFNSLILDPAYYTDEELEKIEETARLIVPGVLKMPDQRKASSDLFNELLIMYGMENVIVKVASTI